MGRRTLSLPNRKGHYMESLTGLIETKVKNQIDRVTLTKEGSEKLNQWLIQVKDSTKGFLDLSKSDLVNFLIQNHSLDLSKKEIKQIRTSHYSLIKHLNWITPQLKKAIEENNQDLVKSLQLELRSLELGVIAGATNEYIVGTTDTSAENLLKKEFGVKKQRRKKTEIDFSKDKNENKEL